jgi:hypothetical protein
MRNLQSTSPLPPISSRPAPPFLSNRSSRAAGCCGTRHTPTFQVSATATAGPTAACCSMVRACHRVAGDGRKVRALTDALAFKTTGSELYRGNFSASTTLSRDFSFSRLVARLQVSAILLTQGGDASLVSVAQSRSKPDRCAHGAGVNSQSLFFDMWALVSRLPCPSTASGNGRRGSARCARWLLARPQCL